MWSIIKNNFPGVLMITGTGALFGMMMAPRAELYLLAAAGAFCGGVAAVGLFGHPGRWGWGLAALGGVVATALGAGIAGGVVQFPDGIFIAPLAVALFPTEMLLAGPFWAGMMAVTHLLTRRLRTDQPQITSF